MQEEKTFQFFCPKSRMFLL